MTDSADIGAEYRRRLEARRTALGAKERAHARFGYLRLLIAGLALAVLVVSGWKAGPWLFVLLFAFVAIAFAHARLLNARDQAASAVAYYERGLSRIAFEWIGHGRTGERFLPADHLYAADLDLFGRGSLFELLSTARTQAGEETIASWLLTPAPPATIRARQDAVRELTTRLDLRETVAVMGDSVRVGVDAGLLRRWSTSPSRLRGIGTRLALAGLSTATIAASVAWIATGRWEGAMAALLLLQGLVAQSFKARVQAVIHAVDEPAHDLDLLAGLLGLVERETFTSPYLHGLQQAIATDGRPASAQIAKLSQLVALLSSRQNILFAMPAAMLLWATQCSFAIEAWRRRAGAHVPRWLDAIGEFEALLSLATFAAEHPSYVFPTVVEGPATLATTAVAHPALPPAAVANDVTLDTRETALLVVSGSNMSGKSTLLRTLGANAVLAQMGAPVRASAFRLSPLALGAAIRVLDSLTDGRSRFFAEITRLKGIVDLSIARQGAVLFLLDEILGGTNSHDRRLGADALLTGLVEAGAIGLATTHDLALGEIADRLGVRARNVHFVDRFEHGELTFDYQIRPGLVRTSNAIALMRSIGLKV